MAQGARDSARTALVRIGHVAGSLNPVEQFRHVDGYVNAVSEHGDSLTVVDAASDLFVEVYDDGGRRTRTAIADCRAVRGSSSDLL